MRDSQTNTAHINGVHISVAISPDIRVLDFDGDFAAVLPQPGTVDLGQGRCPQGLRTKVTKHLVNCGNCKRV